VTVVVLMSLILLLTRPAQAAAIFSW
jgi:hypothetical protein